MEIFDTILIMLALVGVSNVLNHQLPFIPVPLFQIALGSMMLFVDPRIPFHFEPELFFVLFIAPLLYNDGKHTPRGELWRLRAPILLLAIGLVFATVLILGSIIHAMIPSIPLPAAYGLAAILSPTDAVAVGALAGRIHLPKRLMHLLEGEALMNDASGLVAFKFAIAAAVTGVFSLPGASVSFLVIFVGGLVVGAVLAAIITVVRWLLRRSGLDNETLHMLIHILTPFVLFISAEKMGLSGILAAVAGGVMHAIERDQSNKIKPRSSEMADHTWTVIVYVLNGLVFVMLGMQLPDVFHQAMGGSTPAYYLTIIAYAVAIYLLLIVLRFLWVLAYTLIRRAHQPNISVKLLVMTSLSGVRGAVTLAGAFTIPLVVNNGDPFPERELMIFLATFVILLSLAAASVLLPWLAKNKEENREEEDDRQAYEGQIRIMRAAIRAVRQASTDENEGEAAAVIADYDQWMLQIRYQEQRGASSLMAATIRLEALAVERDTVEKMRDRKEIDERLAGLYLSQLTDMEMILSRQQPPMLIVLKRLGAAIARAFKRLPSTIPPSDREALRELRLQASTAVVETLEEKYPDARRGEASEVIRHYRYLMQRLSAMHPRPRAEANEEAKRDLQWIAIQAEREEVQTLYVDNEISRETASELRRHIRERETFILESELT